MPYSVLQTTLDPPDREALRRAFARVSFLTRHDADSLAKDAYGVLADRLSLDHARAVQEALRLEHIPTVVEDDATLFSVPGPQSTRRVECNAKALVWYDTYDRAHLIGWPHVVLIAAGVIGDVSRQQELMWVTTVRNMPMPVTTLRETTNFGLSLEIFTDLDPMRLRVEPDRCNYSYLGERLQSRAEDNFILLVRDVVRYAGNTLVNRGATSICDGSDHVRVYLTQRAFDEETAWWVWRSLNADSHDGAPAQ